MSAGRVDVLHGGKGKARARGRGRGASASLNNAPCSSSRPVRSVVVVARTKQLGSSSAKKRQTKCLGLRDFFPRLGSEKRFAASVTVDEELLHVSPTQLIQPYECQRIYGYPRDEDMKKKYELGKVIGAGSFGVVREAEQLSTGRKVAVKTISKLLKKVPKHLARQGDEGTISKHLKKLQLEVDAMKSLRGSLNAVSLFDLYEGDQEVWKVAFDQKKEKGKHTHTHSNSKSPLPFSIIDFSFSSFDLLACALLYSDTLDNGVVHGRNNLRENLRPGLHRGLCRASCSIDSSDALPVSQQRCCLHGREA